VAANGCGHPLTPSRGLWPAGRRRQVSGPMTGFGASTTGSVSLRLSALLPHAARWRRTAARLSRAACRPTPHLRRRCCPPASPGRCGGRGRGLSPRPVIWRLVAQTRIRREAALPDRAPAPRPKAVTSHLISGVIALRRKDSPGARARRDSARCGPVGSVAPRRVSAARGSATRVARRSPPGDRGRLPSWRPGHRSGRRSGSRPRPWSCRPPRRCSRP
jgi:hypothetical protein